jgi:V/A-type H+-transporting ATPase subunit C
LDEFSWAYAAGRVKIVEKELLSAAELRQLAGAKSLEASIAALRETYYGRYLAGMGAPAASFDLPLQKALRDAYESVLGYAGEALAVTVFRARHDFHNVKVAVKDRFLGIPSEEEALSIVGNLGVLGMDELLEKAHTARPGDKGAWSGGIDFTGRVDLLVEERAIAGTYLAAGALIERERSGNSPVALALLADSFVDAAYYGWAAAALKRLGYPELRRFFTAEIDLTNLRMAFRAYRQSIPDSLFGRVVLGEGEVGAKAVRSAYGQGPERVENLYAGTAWGSLAASGAALLERKAALTSWERECDNALMRVYRRARYVSLGPEPVIGYLLAKEAEVRNLRVVLSGKESQVPASEILERLRETYV